MIELIETQNEIKKLIIDTPPPGKHCARSAIRHIEKAWEIKNIDPEMAVFRAITGVEESATAIFYSLKRRNYKSSEKLNPRKHTHKSALYPFLFSISQAFAPIKSFLKPQLILEEESCKKIFRVRYSIKGPDNKILWAFPVPPLNFSAKENDKVLDFSEQFSLLASENNVKDISSVIKKAANSRNKILYASQEGIPSLTGSIDKYLLKRQEIIFTNLVIFLMIDPYNEIQLFVQQALAAFLKMLNIIDDMDSILDW